MRFIIIIHSLLLGTLLATAAVVPSCVAQEWSAGGGQGYTPMAPMGPVTSPNLNQSAVPSAPRQQGVASRPTTWPDGGSNASPWPRPSEADMAPVGEVKACEGIRIIGRVGSVAILESEVAGTVNEIIEMNKDRIPPDQLEKQRELLIQQRLKNIIEMKLIYLDAKRSIPEEGWPHIEKQILKQYEDMELDRMMKKAGVSTAREFDQKLRSLGTSLDREKKSYVERTLAQQWVRQQIKRDEEITYDQMVAYYRGHQNEFTAPARARWEHLMVRYGKYPTKVAAFEAIAQLGNQVVLQGRPFAEVARAGSDGITAAQGGVRDWTAKGGLVNEEMDKALFSLPVGQMSPIIQGPDGYHIIRVTEREEEAVRPFLEAQVDIRQKIVEQRSQKQFREYMAKLEARTPVWTIYGDLNKKEPEQVASPPRRQPVMR